MEFQIKISKYSKRGHGLGTIKKTPESPPSSAEVVGTVIGDTALAEVGKKKKRIYSTTLKEIVIPSGDRVVPRCKYAGICGGCTWQQKDYQAQLKTKEKQVETLFGKQPLPIIPAEEPWHYRNKMEYTFSQNKEGEKFLGLIIARSKGRVLNLEECHLTSSWFIKVLGAVREWWKGSLLKAYHGYSDKGTLRTLTLREGKRTGDKMVFITISGNPDYMINKTEIQGFKEAVLKALPDETPSIFLRIQKIAKGTPTTFYEMHLYGPDLIEETLHVNKRALTFKISPDSFFQPNPLQAEKLYTHALKLADPQSTDTVFDLYCGTGTLGVIFAPYVKKVIGIELSPYAICDAEVNIKENNLSNIALHKGDVGSVLSHLNLTADLVIIDPPRSGLDPTAIKHLIRLSPKKILYISCNPLTQSQNISDLISEGYTLKTLQPIDQFPHTYHLENIAVLEKC
ncbi:MAG: 23S rRNA (uracil(1939)-C(5))-methyltransferase RlmD [Simkaniaceae bacterium]|nr:MAG: 23S rRNA (uracil(1939)-C(5))-methyltransferase RlmD [Simkaniaceae bacterium]